MATLQSECHRWASSRSNSACAYLVRALKQTCTVATGWTIMVVTSAAAKSFTAAANQMTAVMLAAAMKTLAQKA